jgi:hypothetical protein
MFGSIPAACLAGPGRRGRSGAVAPLRALACLPGWVARRAIALASRWASAVQEPALAGTAPVAGTIRPAVTPETLKELRGPASGVVELPVRLYWSAGSRSFDLTSRHDAADMYEAVLDAASSREDLIRYLDADLLTRVWPVLGMSRAKRAAWENQFPVLRRQRLDAAA